jgi:multiple sugar transport system permease protein
MDATIAPPRAKPRRMSNAARRSLIWGLIFVSPWIIGFLGFTIYPLISSLLISFTRYDLLRPPVQIGLANYVELFTDDPNFWKVVSNTFFYVVLSAPLGVISAFLMAALLNTKIVMRSTFRGIFFFPAIVPAVVTATIWQFLLNSQYGAINATLQAMGMPIIPFLSNPDLIKPTLILIYVWAQGSAILVFLAALQDVPRQLYEAAEIDGANSWQRFWKVTLPMCTPAILYNMVTSFIVGFQVFTLPYLLVGPNGGPERSGQMYAALLYDNAFRFLRMGKASALAWVLFVVIVFFTIMLFRSSARWVYYGGDDAR